MAFRLPGRPILALTFLAPVVLSAARLRLDCGIRATA